MPDIVAAKPKKRRPGRLCRRPGRPTPGRLRPAYATHSSRLRYSLDVPDNTLLTHRPRQHATWLMVPEHLRYRSVGGVLGRGAMPVGGVPPAPLVVRAGGL